MNIAELNDIASTLRMLPDDRLAAFATMHKDDPYVLSLAVSESTQRKKIRAANAAPIVGPSGTVADEQIAQMAEPADVGIAALPAPNMQGMAVGGIVGTTDDYDTAVGYAEGGAVERYKNQGLTGAPQFIQDLLAIPGAYEEWWKRQREEDARKAALEKESAEKRRAILESQGKASFFNYMFGSPQREAEGKAELAAAAAAASGAAPSSAAPSRASTPSIEGELDPTTGRAMTPSATAPVAPPGPPAPPAPAPRPPAAPSVTLPPSPDIQTLYSSMLPKEPRQDPFAEQRRELSAAEVKAAEAAQADIEKEIKDRGVAFADREARLKQRQEKLAGQEKELKGSALLEAGLAILSGTSPNALQNIGQGAMVGARAYKQGMKELDEGREKLDDAFGRIEEFRRNEAMLDSKERRAAKTAIRTAQNAGLKSLLDGAEKAYGMDREDAKTMFTGAIQLQNARIHAGATLGAANIKARSDQQYLEYIRGAQTVETARNNIWKQVSEDTRYQDPQVKQAEFERRWALELQRNPNLAKYAGAVGGGSAPSQSDPLGLRGR